MYKDTNVSDESLVISTKNYSVDKITKWWESRKEIKDVEVYNQSQNAMVLYESEENAISCYLTERPKDTAKQNKVIFLEGQKRDYPKSGEVWISSSAASAYSVEVGNSITFLQKKDSKKLKVSAIVVDPYFSAAMLNPKRFWVGPGEISKIFPSDDKDTHVIAIKYKNFLKYNTSVWNDFEDYLKAPFVGLHYKIDLVSYVYNIQYLLIGAVLLLFSIIIIAVALFIISYSISNAVLSDYKIIGILKAQGFSSNNISSIYLIQYLLISIVAVPIGIGLSYFIIQATLNTLLKTIGTKDLNSSLTLPFILITIFLLIIIAITASLSTRKAKKIKPVEAIKSGLPSSNLKKETKLSLLYLKNLPFPVAIAIKDMFSQKRKTAFLMFSIIITVFIFSFSINLDNSVSGLLSNRGYWGYNDSNVSITLLDPQRGLSGNKLKNMLKGDNKVEIVMVSEQYSKVGMGKDKEQSAAFFANCFEGDLDSMGVVNIKGRNPVEDDEISLAVNSSKKYKKDVGDKIKIYINEKEKEFRVTGIYQSFENNGEGFRVNTSVIKQLDTSYTPAGYIVKLKPGTDVKKYIKELDKEIGDDATINDVDMVLSNQLGQITSGVGLATKVLSIIVLLISFLNIFNMTLLNIIQDKKTYGIYKSQGLINSQLNIMLVFKVILTAVIGIMLAIPLSLALAPKILSILFSGIGISVFPFNINVVATILVIPISLIVFIIGTLIPAKQIGEINPRNLVDE